MSWETAAYFIVCVFAAAIVRGYSGFGFSLLAFTSLSLVLTPAEVIPPVFLMEVAASVSLLPSIWKDIHWRALAWLSLGCLVGTPVGVWCLASLPAAPMKVAMGVAVFTAVVLLWVGYARKTMPGTAATLTTGGVSGVLNGAFGIGGPPVVLFFFSSPAGTAIGRASLIAFFIGTDAMALGFLAREGLVTSETFTRFLMLVPPLLAGQWIGARSFKTADPATFRRWVLALLAALAVSTGVQGVLALAA